jgi:glucokinase
VTALYAGIDLGGTTITAGMASADGTVLARRNIATQSEDGPDAVLERMARLVEGLAKETQSTPSAVGVGVPGLVDLATGTTRFLPNLATQWRDIPVAQFLTQRLHCPVRVLNDARAAALGELKFGLGRSARSMAFFTLGTGIGGGVVIDGKLLLGPLGAAGELGHQTILPNGPLCGCGNRGCLESLASGPAIMAAGIRLLRSGMAPNLHTLVGGDANQVTPRSMAAAAASGDTAVRDVLLESATFLGIGVANVVTALHPDLVVLGGGVAEIGELLITHVRQVVRQRVRMFPVDDVRVEKSAVGDGAGLLGAIGLAIHGFEF